MDKATRLSIKEFSEFTGFTESTLRYYDQLGLLSPVFRGENRYRYYSPQQIIAADFLKVLTKVGVPLSAIKTLGKNRAPESVLAVLTQQESKLDAQLRELQAAYAIIHAYRNNIQAGIVAREHDMEVRELDAIPLDMGQVNDFSGAESFYEPFMQFCTTAQKNKTNVLYPIGGYYEDIQAFLRAPSQPTRFFTLDPSGNSRRKAGQYLVACHKGSYGEFGDLPQKLHAHAQAHGLAFCGPLYVTYLLDEVCVTNHEHYVAQIVAGVSKTL